jgi:hypothetical protein
MVTGTDIFMGDPCEYPLASNLELEPVHASSCALLILSHSALPGNMVLSAPQEQGLPKGRAILSIPNHGYKSNLWTFQLDKMRH